MSRAKQDAQVGKERAQDEFEERRPDSGGSTGGSTLTSAYDPQATQAMPPSPPQGGSATPR